MIDRRSPQPAVWPTLLWAAIVALLVLWAVYPGFMSYDSLHALREARGHVRGGPYPPFVSYVWRPLDVLFPGPAAMLLTQNALLLLAIASIFVLSGFGPVAATIGLTLVALMPPVLGPMLVVWKDVAMSACFAAAAAILWLSETRRQQASRCLRAAAIALLFCGMALRLNALPGAAPLLVWAAAIGWRRGAHAESGRGRPTSRGRVLRALLGGGALTLVLFAGVTVINTFRLPDFSRLAPNPSLRALQIYDLVGTASKAGRLPFRPPPTADEATLLAEARAIYDPRHLNLTMEARPDGVYRRLAATATPQAVTQAWLEAVTASPGAYLAHRWAVFGELVGFTPREVFYPTHGGIDANEFGYEHRPGRASRGLLHYLRAACGPSPVASLACRGWLYHLAGLVAVLACAVFGGPTRRIAALAVYASGLAYLLPQFLIAPAADLRYEHWSVIGSILACVIALGMLTARGRAGGRRRAAPHARGPSERTSGAKGLPSTS